MVAAFFRVALKKVSISYGLVVYAIFCFLQNNYVLYELDRLYFRACFSRYKGMVGAGWPRLYLVHCKYPFYSNIRTPTQKKYVFAGPFILVRGPFFPVSKFRSFHISDGLRNA